MLPLLVCALSHSWPANKDRAWSVGDGCSVRLVRQLLPNVCVPERSNATAPPSHNMFAFSCADEASVTVHGRCAGLFQCGNGATTMCGRIRAGPNDAFTCNCSGIKSACHLNPYTRRQACPPAIPFPPAPPPSPPRAPSPPRPPPRPHFPPVDPIVRQCARWCHEGHVHHNADSQCKCGACRPLAANQTHVWRHGEDDVLVKRDVVDRFKRGEPCAASTSMLQWVHETLLG
jgi:hypothetical protein